MDLGCSAGLAGWSSMSLFSSLSPFLNPRKACPRLAPSCGSFEGPKNSNARTSTTRISPKPSLIRTSQATRREPTLRILTPPERRLRPISGREIPGPHTGARFRTLGPTPIRGKQVAPVLLRRRPHAPPDPHQRPHPSAREVLLADGGPHDGAGHRRQHGHLQRRARRAPRAASVPAAGPAGPVLQLVPARHAAERRYRGDRVPRGLLPATLVFAGGYVGLDRRQSDYLLAARPRDDGSRLRVASPDARNLARGRSLVLRRRGDARQGSRPRPQPRAVAVEVRRGPRRGGQDRHRRRKSIRDRRNLASRIRASRQAGSVGPARAPVGLLLRDAADVALPPRRGTSRSPGFVGG